MTYAVLHDGRPVARCTSLRLAADALVRLRRAARYAGRWVLAAGGRRC